MYVTFLFYNIILHTAFYLLQEVRSIITIFIFVDYGITTDK